ncbi:MAG: patatin-like phospholipase family protein [Chloroflexota bacterium]
MEIALALGGGGVKGAAHLGVLEVLDREGFEIQALAGTSVGGLIGAVYLCGVSPQEIKDEFRDLELTKLYGRQKGDEPSLLGFEGITKILSNFLGDRTFADLPIPFATTAVDLDRGEVIIFNEGPLIDAVLASTAVPGVFPARRWKGRLLVDGGVLCPVPIRPVRELRSDLPLVAVALNQRSMPGESFNVPETPTTNAMVEYISRLRLAQAINVFVRSSEMSSIRMTELLLKTQKPEVAILPNLHGVGMLDQIDVSEIAKRGEIAALEMLPELRAAVSPWKKPVRWIKNKAGVVDA